MLARAAFLFLFLAPIFAEAKADNCPVALFEPFRAGKEKVQGMLGGAGSCAKLTPKEIKNFECRTDVLNVGRTLTMADDLNGIAVGMFFQGLASNSHRQAVCRNAVISKYSNDPAAKQQMNEKVEQSFKKIHQQLKSLVMSRNELQSNLDRMKIEAAADRAMSMMTFKGREQHQKSIDSTNEKIVRLLTTVPLGYDPDVARSLIQMSLGESFDAGLFESGVKGAALKYEETASYYKSKFTEVSKDRGSYCLGLDYRNMAGESGQINKWLDSLPNETPEDRSMKQKLSCQLDARYETGNERFSDGVMFLGVATYMLPPAWIPRVGGAVIGAAELGARGAAAVVAVLSMDAMRAQCFPPSGIISGDGQQCDPDKDFAHTLQESDTTKCAGMVLMSASLAAEARGVTLAVQAARAKNAIAPKNVQEVGEGLSQSRIFSFYKKGKGRVPITKDTFTPGKSYVTVEHNGKIVIGEDIVGFGGTTSGSHLTLRDTLTNYQGMAGGRGGSIRTNPDGSIDVSGYHALGIDIKASKEAARVLVEQLKAALPGVKIRSTHKRLSTLRTK